MHEIHELHEAPLEVRETVYSLKVKADGCRAGSGDADGGLPTDVGCWRTIIGHNDIGTDCIHSPNHLSFGREVTNEHYLGRDNDCWYFDWYGYQSSGLRQTGS